METIQVTLAAHVVAAVKREADSIGVTVEELLRFEIGRRFGTPIPYFPQPIPGVVSGASFPAPKMDPVGDIILQAQAAAAALGQLHCADCTQLLSIADVREGVCKHCGGTIPT